jgi:acyl-CoA hydrolase
MKNESEGKAPEESHVEMTEMVLPQHTNAIGTVFGGTVMSWVDIAAATCGMRHCRKQVVTASIDAMHFLAPIRLGWIVTIRAAVNFTSKSSAEIGVKVEAENPLSGERFHTASAYVTMVALDSNGRPSSVPPIVPQTDAERRRFEAAKDRRKARLELKEQIRARDKGKS